MGWVLNFFRGVGRRQLLDESWPVVYFVFILVEFINQIVVMFRIVDVIYSLVQLYELELFFFTFPHFFLVFL